MPTRLFALLFLAAALFSNCKNDRRPRLKIAVEQTDLRSEAGEKSQAISILKRGQTVRDAGEISPFFSEIELDGHPFLEPWVKVETENGTVGWVFAAAVREAENHANWLISRRLQSFFGKPLATRIASFSEKNERISTAADFAENWRTGQAVADSMNQILPQKATANDAGELPDFFWLNHAMPCFLTQKVAEGSAFHLFHDYRFWLKKAVATPQPDDDAFIQTCLAAFPTDSIESFFPSWKIQLTDYESASMLGSGSHLRMLESIANSLKISKLFQKELAVFKEALLHDIASREVEYWFPAPKIVEELQAIRAADFPFFSNEDQILLDERRRQFENPSANGLRVNRRAGE